MDSTWAYYSIFLRNKARDPIAQKLGSFWPSTHFFDWSKIPGIIARSINEDIAAKDPESKLKADIVKVVAFTSMRNDTRQDSNRIKLTNDLQKTGFEVHKFVTEGIHEKCVDISMAVEMVSSTPTYDIGGIANNIISTLYAMLIVAYCSCDDWR
jgi:hypothetical protein